MIKEIVTKWENNKSKLEDWFKSVNSSIDYKDIVEKIIELVINDSEDNYDHYNVNKMTIIDNGDYQGTQIFIIPRNRYQPSIDEYIVTHTYYGSCSGCDTLAAINDCFHYDDDNNIKVLESQLKDYMTLALHLVQKMKYLEDPK